VVVLFAVLGSLLAGALVVERRQRTTAAEIGGEESRDAFVATAAEAEGSVWFCPGGTAVPDGVADLTVVVANPTTRPATVTFDLVAEDGTRAAATRRLAPGGRVDLTVREVLEKLRVGAVVRADVGGVVAEQVVDGGRGRATTPCAAQASDQWYFADGSTLRGARTQLWLLNPYPEPALVDLSFLSEIGPSRPRAFQGLPVAPRGLRVVEVGGEVRRRAGLGVPSSNS
jgi:hypothetical protein